MKKLFLTLTIFLLSVSFYPVNAMEKTADILKENVVTTGDGLYVDSTVDGRYIYRGGNPSNYIRLGDDLYRIISVEKDGTIKVIKQESIGEMKWDEEDARDSTNNNDLCIKDYGYYDGCNAWGSNTTTLDSNGNNVTQMPREANGILKNIPDKEAILNTYLNNDFYNGLSDNVKSLIIEGIWNVGPIEYTQTNLLESVKKENAYKWKGRVALINATDYVKASTNSACSSVKDFLPFYIGGGGNSSCYNNSSTHNYIYSSNDQWFVTPAETGYANYAFYVTSSGAFEPNFVRITNGVRPAFFLSSETTLAGEGTETNPYTISKYIEEPKDEGNTKDEIKVDNGQIVEVPSTSAFGSIIVAGLGLACVTGSVYVTNKATRKK